MAKTNGKRVRRRIWIGLLAVAIAGIGFAATRPKTEQEDKKDKTKPAAGEACV